MCLRFFCVPPLSLVCSCSPSWFWFWKFGWDECLCSQSLHKASLICALPLPSGGLCLFPCRLILVHVFCFCQRLPLFLSSFSDIVAPRFLHWMILELCLPWVLVSDLVSVCASFPCRSDRFRLVIAACASSLATNILILLRFSLLLHHSIHVHSPLEQLCWLSRYSPQENFIV